MSFAEQPYGPLVDTTMTVMTWNVWGRFGPWEERAAAIVATIGSVRPDVLLLQESWIDDHGGSQAAELGAALSMHWAVDGGELLFGEWGLSNAVLSRWPIGEVVAHELPRLGADGWGGAALRCLIDGPRRPVLAYSVALDWPPSAGAAREHALAHLMATVADDVETTRGVLVLGGDLNASPDSDEVRLLTGRRGVARPGFVLFDAWSFAEEVAPGVLPLGATWSRRNPFAAPSLLPDARIDYLFGAMPRRGGVGSIVRAHLAGDERTSGAVPAEAPFASDHFAVVAEFRY